MNLHFLGFGGAFHPELGNTSAYLWADDAFFLLDCGETVFSTLYKSGLLARAAHITVLITHLHADHCASLPTLIAYCHYVLGKTVHVVYPQNALAALLSLQGAAPDSFVLHETNGPLCLQGITLKAVQVAHAPGMGCYGYLLHKGEESCFFSGDAASVPDTVVQAFLRGEIGRLYVDCRREEHADHGSLARLCAVIPPQMRARTVCMHLSPGDEEAIRQAGFIPATDWRQP